jgi:hypothetical protein
VKAPSKKTKTKQTKKQQQKVAQGLTTKPALSE